MATFGMKNTHRAFVAVVRPDGQLETAWVGGPVNSRIVEITGMGTSDDGWAFAINPEIKQQARIEGWKLAQPYFEAEGMMDHLKSYHALVKAGVSGHTMKGVVFPESSMPDAIKLLRTEAKTKGMWNPLDAPSQSTPQADA